MCNFLSENEVELLKENIQKDETAKAVYGQVEKKTSLFYESSLNEYWKFQVWEWRPHAEIADFLFNTGLKIRLNPENRDEELIESALKIFRKYADNYTTAMQAKPYPFLPHNWGVSFPASLYSLDFALAFQFFRPWMSKSLEAHVKDDFLFPHLHLLKTCFNDCWNGHAWVDCAIAALGFALESKEDVDFAVDGPYGFKHHVRHQILADGRMYEDHTSYNMFFLQPLLHIAELAKRFCWKENLYDFTGPGIDTKYLYLHQKVKDMGYSEETFHMRLPDEIENNSRSLRKAIEALFNLLLPNLTFIEDNPSMDDHNYACNADRFWNIFFLSHHAYKDPAYAWLLKELRARNNAFFLGKLRPLEALLLLQHGNDHAEHAAPRMESLRQEHCGHIVMRTEQSDSYWQGSGMTLSMSFGHNRVKSQTKRMDLDLYAYGTRIYRIGSLGNGTHQSGVGRDNNLINGLTVDQQPVQDPWEGKGRFGKLLYWKQESTFQIAQILFEGAYAGTTQIRTLVLHPEFLLDVLEAESSDQHLWTYSACVDGPVEIIQAFSPNPDMYERYATEEQVRRIKHSRWQIENIWMNLFLWNKFDISLYHVNINGTNKIDMTTRASAVKFVGLHVPGKEAETSWRLVDVSSENDGFSSTGILLHNEKTDSQYKIALSSSGKDEAIFGLHSA